MFEKIERLEKSYNVDCIAAIDSKQLNFLLCQISTLNYKL